MSTFGRELQSIRNSKNLSLKDVAKRGGLSHSYLSQIENKRRNPPKPEMIKKIADGLGVEHNELMALAGYIQKIDDLNTYTLSLGGDISKLEDQTDQAKIQLKYFESLKTQEELISAVETLSDLYKALTAKTDLFYKDHLLTEKEKEKILTVIETILE